MINTNPHLIDEIDQIMAEQIAAEKQEVSPMHSITNVPKKLPPNRSNYTDVLDKTPAPCACRKNTTPNTVDILPAIIDAVAGVIQKNISRHKTNLNATKYLEQLRIVSNVVHAITTIGNESKNSAITPVTLSPNQSNIIDKKSGWIIMGTLSVMITGGVCGTIICCKYGVTECISVISTITGMLLTYLRDIMIQQHNSR